MTIPNALTNSLPMFDGKTERFELLQDLVTSKLLMYTQLTEGRQLNEFHSLQETKGNSSKSQAT